MEMVYSVIVKNGERHEDGNFEPMDNSSSPSWILSPSLFKTEKVTLFLFFFFHLVQVVKEYSGFAMLCLDPWPILVDRHLFY